MNGWKKWIIRTAILMLISGAGYAGMRDRDLAKMENQTETNTKEITVIKQTVNVERKENIQAQNNTNERLAGIEAKLDLLLENRGLIK